MKWKIIVVSITLLLIISSGIVAVGGEAPEGEESVSEPNGIEENEVRAAQEISDWHDLDAVRDDPGSDYVLVNDLDESTAGYEYHASESANGGKGWPPIGDESNPFTGTFDGQEHTITGLNINRTDEKAGGLFAGMIEGAKINNVGLEDVDINIGSFEQYEDSGTGGLVGLAGASAIENCYVTGTVEGVYQVGGILGAGENYEMRNCYSDVNVSGNESYIGGIVGVHAENTTIENSYFINNVSGSNNVGALVGYDYSSAEVNNSYYNTDHTDAGGPGKGRNTTEMTYEHTESKDTFYDYNETIWDLSDHELVIDKEGNSGYPALEWQNNPPDAPSNPLPSDGADGVSTNPTLSVDVSDPDGDSMDVSFHETTAQELWSYNHGDPVYGIATDGSGNVYAGGYKNKVVKIDSDGNELWSYNYGDAVDGVATDGSGNVYAGGDNNSVVKIDSHGDELWSYNYGDVVYGVATDGSGNVYAGGYDEVVKIDSDGSELWSYKYGDSVHGIATDGSGNVYAGGYDDNVVKIDSDGSELWSYNYADSVRGVATDGSGNVYVGGDNNDLVKIDSDGNELWSYNCGDWVYGVATDGSGNVYAGAYDELVKLTDKIGEDTSVPSGSTASVTWNDLDEGTTYHWYAVADDGEFTTTSDTWGFTTNAAPDAPSSPSPSDGADGVSTNPLLSVDVSDPDGDSMDVTFHDDSDGSQIGSTQTVSGGSGTASVTWNDPDEGTTYNWSAVADDGELTTTSDTWSFTTNAAPDAPSNPSPSDGATKVGTAPTLSVDVSDSDGDPMDVSFYDDSDGSQIGSTQTVSGGSGTASVTWSDLSLGTTYSWYVEADDGQVTTQSEIWGFTTNYTLSISSTPGGQVEVPGEGDFNYGSGETVDLEAVADEGYYFDGWTGDTGSIGDTDSNQTTIEIGGNHTITATFSEYILSVDTDPKDTEAGQAINGYPAAIVTDQLGDPIQGVDVTVTAFYDSNDTRYTFDTGNTTQTTGTDGIATFDDLKINNNDTYYLEFDALGLTNRSGSFDIDPASADSVVVWTQPEGTTAGQAINGHPEANVTDRFGNPVQGVNVTVTAFYNSTDTQYTFDAGNATQGTGADGIATFDDLVIESTGTYQLKFNVTGVTENATSNSFEITSSSAAYIDIEPTTSTVTAGDAQNYTAKVYDRYGNVIEEVTNDTVWEIEGGAGGEWSENGTYTSENSGTWNVTAVYMYEGDEMTDNATINVLEGDPERIEISPGKETIDAGTMQEYNATAYDDIGNEFEVTAEINWEIDDGAGGEWDGNVYTSEVAGSWNVTGTYLHDGEELTDNGTLIVEPGDADFIVIEPVDEKIVAGESVAYHTTAYDGVGNEIGNVTEKTEWGIDGGAGGRWSGNEYTSEVAGNWTVTGTYNDGEEDLVNETSLIVEPLEYILAIAIEGEGSTEPGEGTHSYEEGEEVTVNATPAEGWYFVEWTGDHNGTDEEITLGMDENKSITAHFQEEVTYYNLSIETVGEGKVEINPEQEEYEAGTEVRLEVDPAEGWEFVEWTGDHEGTVGDVNITMDEDKEITAHFEEIQYYLLRIDIEGEGTTDPGEGTHTYEAGTDVTITAAANESWEFVEWTGAYEGTEEEITLTMDENKSITARFEKLKPEFEITDFTVDPAEGQPPLEVNITGEIENVGEAEGSITLETDGQELESWTLAPGDSASIDETYTYEEAGLYHVDLGDESIAVKVGEVVTHTLEVTTEGEGTVDVDPDREVYEEGAEVTLTADPNEGWEFVEWTGAYEGTEGEITLTMDENKSITARFEELKAEFEITDFTVDPAEGEAPLEVNITGEIENVGEAEGTITLETDGEKLNNWTLAPGDTASVNETYTYGEDGLYHVDLGDESISVEVGEVVTYTLEVTTEGEGTVDVDPDREVYEAGTGVTLTADPSEGWKFTGWTGDYNGTEEEINITMDEDKHVFAHFEEGGDIETYTLTLNVEGEGNISPAEGSYTYKEGAEVTITATPDEGWYFVEWTGDYNRSEKEINIIMDSETEITAHFEKRGNESIFEVDILEFDEEVEIGDEIRVIYSVKNTGEAEDTQEITFRVSGVNIEVVEVSLGPGEEDTGNFTMKAEEARFRDGGEFDFEVISEDESESVSIVVEETAKTTQEDSFLSNYWWIILVILVLSGAFVSILVVRKREKRRFEDQDQQPQRRQNEGYQQKMNYTLDGESEQRTPVGGGVGGLSGALRDLDRTTKSRAYEYMTQEKGIQMEFDEFEEELERLVREEKVIQEPQKEGEDLYRWAGEK